MGAFFTSGLVAFLCVQRLHQGNHAYGCFPPRVSELPVLGIMVFWFPSTAVIKRPVRRKLGEEGFVSVHNSR